MDLSSQANQEGGGLGTPSAPFTVEEKHNDQVICWRGGACRGWGRGRVPTGPAPASHTDAPSRTPRVLTGPGPVSPPSPGLALGTRHGPDEERTHTRQSAWSELRSAGSAREGPTGKCTFYRESDFLHFY